MGAVRGAAAVAAAVRTSKGRYPLSRRLMAVLPMIRDTLRGRWPGAPKARVIGGVAGLLYVVSPIDILPEILLGPFGLGDDLALAAVSVAALLTAAEDYLEAKEGTRAPAGAATTPGSTAPHGEVIPGVVLDRR